jgi:hypothetical protein
MIRHRTNEWYRARIGRFTASNFADLMTKPANKDSSISKTANNCIEKAAAQLYYNNYHERPDNDATRWGLSNESRAIKEFSNRTNFNTVEMGFIEHPIISEVGATPDAKVIDPTRPGDLIIAQIKCPYNPQIHLDYLNKIYDTDSLKKKKSACYWQMQGEMWVTSAVYSYFVSFDPRLLGSRNCLHIVKINRNQDAIYLLEEVIRNSILLRDKFLYEFNNRIKFPKSLSDYY